MTLIKVSIFFSMLRNESKALCPLGKCSATDLYTQTLMSNPFLQVKQGSPKCLSTVWYKVSKFRGEKAKLRRGKNRSMVTWLRLLAIRNFLIAWGNVGYNIILYSLQLLGKLYKRHKTPKYNVEVYRIQ